MDWHLFEVGALTTLATWVFLFSPSPGSRLLAAIVMGVNVLWILIERERPAKGGRRAGHPLGHHLSPGAQQEAAASEPPKPLPGVSEPDPRIL